MKIVYIYRSEPDETTKKIAEELGKGNEVYDFKLYEGIDYDELAKRIVECDRVICWW